MVIPHILITTIQDVKSCNLPLRYRNSSPNYDCNSLKSTSKNTQNYRTDHSNSDFRIEHSNRHTINEDSLSVRALTLRCQTKPSIFLCGIFFFFRNLKKITLAHKPSKVTPSRTNTLHSVQKKHAKRRVFTLKQNFRILFPSKRIINHF